VDAHVDCYTTVGVGADPLEKWMKNKLKSENMQKIETVRLKKCPYDH